MTVTTSRAIAVANSKGGCSKTTVLANLAVFAARQSSRVALLDYDPKPDLTRWWERRDDMLNPRLWRGTDGPRLDVPDLKVRGTEWIFIDTPPGTTHIVEGCIAAADFVLIPCKASPMDLDAVDPIVETCLALGKPFRFVLTMYDAKWKITATAAPYLEAKAPGHVLSETLRYNPSAYVASMIDGLTAPEYHDKKLAADAKREVGALWKAVEALALASAPVE